MSDTKFTPGPWIVKREKRVGTKGLIDINIVADGWYVAVVCEGVCRNNDLSIDDADANARLIAAAPTLVAALKTARKWVEIAKNDACRGSSADLETIDTALTQARPLVDEQKEKQ